MQKVKSRSKEVSGGKNYGMETDSLHCRRIFYLSSTTYFPIVLINRNNHSQNKPKNVYIHFITNKGV